MKYLGLPIFETSPLRKQQSNTLGNGYTEIGKGYKTQQKVVLKPVQRGFEWSFIFQTRAECIAFRDFFRSNLGRYGKFWIPSYKNDLILVDEVVPGDKIKVKNTKRLFGLFGLNRHIYIKDKYAGKIESIEVKDGSLNGDETIKLSVTLPNLTKDTKVEYLFLVRLKNDEFKITNVQNRAFEISLGFIELQGETP